MRLIIVALGAIGLILFVAFIGARLVRSRTAGISIRMQVFLALASIVGAFAFGLGLLVIDRIEARATLLAEESARAEASAIATLFAGEVGSGVSLDDVVERLEPAHRRGALSFALLDESGRAVFESGLSPTEPGTVSMTAPILVRDRAIGLVRVVKPTIVIERMLTDFAPTVLVISLVLGAAAAASAALIGRAIAAPIEGLTDFAERVSEGRARASPPPPQGREVQRLTQAIDSMRRQIEGRPFVETFAADLSHELKNPVAAIRASAEVLADGALDEPDEAERFVSRILESTGRIEALLGDLLSLARIEARGVENAELCDIVAIARSVAADSASARVEIEGGAGSVRGDPKWLTRALDNLVDNAVTHGVPGSLVRVTIERARSEVSVVVESEGEVRRHVKPRLFRRFVTTRADRGGTGLGLAIVRAVAEAHGGSAECVEPGPPRVRFRLVLPGS